MNETKVVCSQKVKKNIFILRGRRSPTDQIRKISSSFGKKVLYNKKKKNEKYEVKKKYCMYVCICV